MSIPCPRDPSTQRAHRTACTPFHTLAFLSAIILVTAMARLTAIAGPQAVQKPAQEKPAFILSSEALRQQASQDENKVELYKNRLLEVSGTIGFVIQEPPLRGLGFGKPGDSPLPLLCEFGTDKAHELNKLKPGQKVTIRGVFAGKTQEGFLGMIKCRVVPK